MDEDTRFTLLEQGCVLGGFLSYKPAFLQMIYDAYRPTLGEPAATAPRPMLPEVEDLTEKVELKDPRIKNLKL